MLYAQCAAEEKYLRIYEDVVQQNEILVSYLAKRQNATLTKQPAERDLGPYLGQRQRHQGSHEPLERIASRGAWLTSGGSSEVTVKKVGETKKRRTANGRRNILTDFGINLLEEGD